MLALRDVTAGYAGTAVLHGVSLAVDEGSFVGLIGPNGSGKTTLLRVASGVLAPTAGEVLLQGGRVDAIDRRELARTMACLSQELVLDLPFTVRQVVLMGRAPHLPRVGGESERDHTIAERCMALADVTGLADRPITETSGGERQRAFIAMCLAQEPHVLLLDEPTSHLDIAHQLAILDLIRGLNRDRGLTVVAVLHDLNLAAEYCDAVALLDRGAVGAFGPPAEVLTAEAIAAVYGAQVTVQTNPVSGRPHVIVAAGTNTRKDSGVD
jgi:iron complex transport system ATP-binding protein